MKRLVAYVVGVDEDIAEKAFNDAVSAVSFLSHVKVKKNSTQVEPHDDYRGIVASIDYEFDTPEANESRNASKEFQDAFQSVVKASLWNINQARVIIESSPIS